MSGKNPSRPGTRLGVTWPFLLVVVVTTSQVVSGASVVGSRHDLSTPYDDHSNRVCAYCHTPHLANTEILGGTAPLWNRAIDTTKIFNVYSSGTMNTVPGDPNLSYSILCLGCHDGTISYNAVVNGISYIDKHDMILAPGTGPDRHPDHVSYPNCERCHPDYGGDGHTPKWQGTDLRNDHPIFMTYPTAAQDPKFNPPPNLATGWSRVPLYNGKIECATCHDVHDPGIVPFLRMSNAGSALCVVCHQK